MKITGHVKLFSLDHVRAVLTQRHAQKKTTLPPRNYFCKSLWFYFFKSCFAEQHNHSLDYVGNEHVPIWRCRVGTQTNLWLN